MTTGRDSIRERCRRTHNAQWEYRHRIMRRIHSSIFLKLILVMIVTGITVDALVFGFFGSQFNRAIKDAVHTNMEQYFGYVAHELGSPPDTLRARKMAENYGLRIKYKSTQLEWQYPPQSRIVKHGLLRPHKATHQIIGHEQIQITNADGSYYIMEFNFSMLLKRHRRNLGKLLLLLAGIFVLSFLAIRYILRPLRWIKRGVEQVGHGNLDHKIPIVRPDELGELSRSFNEMTQRIKAMLHARDQLLMDVSHELRSPITRMKIALEFMPEGEHRRRMADDLAELETMITEILESERLNGAHGKLHLNNTDIVALLNEVSAAYADRHPGVQLPTNYSTIIVMIDAERMRLLFKNLLDNATKYALPDSGTIQVEIEKKENVMTIFIRDDGPGIPDEHLPYLFEPFYRVDKSRSKKTGGYGLGLSLCKKIVEAHGGTIAIKNNLDKRGVQVTIQLPVQE
ncbi:HAMP domain-containing histidine kinase [candidate division KSB1 bacterium]|nr:HAMP domain-containing histidine kinase [candidate division KSB1 bacterium]